MTKHVRVSKMQRKEAQKRNAKNARTFNKKFENCVDSVVKKQSAPRASSVELAECSASGALPASNHECSAPGASGNPICGCHLMGALSDENYQLKDLIEELKIENSMLKDAVEEVMLKNANLEREKCNLKKSRQLANYKFNTFKKKLSRSDKFTNKSSLEFAKHVSCNILNKSNISPFSSLTNNRSKRNRLNAAIQLLRSLAAENNLCDFWSALERFSARQEFEWSRKLSPEEAMVLISKLRLSNIDVARMKCHLKETGFDIFPSLERIKVAQLNVFSNYDYQNNSEKIENSPQIKVDLVLKKVEPALTARLQTLVNSEILDNSAEAVKIGILGDKGAQTTKTTLAIGAGNRTNSPSNLLLLSVYSGDDKHLDLEGHLKEVSLELSTLKKVKLVDINGNIFEKNLEYFLTGDYMFLCACHGHKGPSCLFPCMICYHSRNVKCSKLTLKEWDFESIPELRSIESYQQDTLAISDKERRGVTAGTSVVFPFVPIENIIPPPLHIMMGMVSKYIYPNLLELAMVADCRTEYEKKVVLKRMDTPTAIRALERNLAGEQTWLECVEEDLKLAQTIVDIWNTSLETNLFHTPQHEYGCDSRYCLRTELYMRGHLQSPQFACCTRCKKDFHLDCCGYTSKAQKHEAEEKPEAIVCFSCRNLKFHYHILPTVQNTLNDMLELKNHTIKTIEDIETSIKTLTKNDPPKGDCCEKLDKVIYGDLKLIRKSYHGGTFNGNDVRKLLIPANIDKIISIFESNQNLQASDFKSAVGSLKIVMNCLGDIMSSSSSSRLSTTEIDALANTISLMIRELKKYKPDETVTPKLHMLGTHVIPFLRRHGTWGEMSEHSIEHFHSEFSLLERQYQQIRDPTMRYNAIARYHAIRNFSHDCRSSQLHSLFRAQ